MMLLMVSSMPKLQVRITCVFQFMDVAKSSQTLCRHWGTSARLAWAPNSPIAIVECKHPGPGKGKVGKRLTFEN